MTIITEPRLTQVDRGSCHWQQYFSVDRLRQWKVASQRRPSSYAERNAAGTTLYAVFPAATGFSTLNYHEARPLIQTLPLHGSHDFGSQSGICFAYY